MCGRFGLAASTKDIAKRFEVQETLFEVSPRYIIAPMEHIAVVTAEGSRRLEGFRWGLVPSWAKDPDIGNRMINARAETIAEKPSFKNALVRRRCLIPVSGFYEWKRAGKAKQPMYIQAASHDLLALAGLWEEWQQPDGTPLHTCAIITTTPNELMVDIHDRMPVILSREGEEA